MEPLEKGKMVLFWISWETGWWTWKAEKILGGNKMLVSIIWLLAIYFEQININDGKLLFRIYIPIVLVEIIIYTIMLPKILDFIDRWKKEKW